MMARAPGFALVPALFLVVVLGALALVAIRVGTGQQQTVTLGVLQSRALLAARSGIEWGAWRALNGSCASSTSLPLTEGALNGFGVTVTCSSTTFSSGYGTAHSYSLAATAIYGTYGQPGYVRRIVNATFTDAG